LGNKLGTKEIKKWIVPSRAMAVAAGKKDLLLIFKPLKGKQDRHWTFVIKQSGYVELHLTKEKPEKEHTTLAEGQINFDRLKSSAEKLYKRSVRPIRKGDKRYSDFTILIPKNSKALKGFQGIFVEKDRFVYPTRNQEQRIEDELEKYFNITYFDELENKGPLFALAFNSTGKRVYYLFSDGKDYYFFPVNQAVKILPESIDWKT